MAESVEQIEQYTGQLLASRLGEPGLRFRASALEKIASGARGQAFAALISTASRHAKRQPLGLSESELAQAEALVPGWSPQAWNQLELLRISLLLARPDLAEDAFAEDFEALFRFADEGETCAFYRSLPLLPAGERFVARAAEGCRTNMLTVFEAIALDSPYPAQYFDDTAWHQLVIKALFLDLAVYRIVGLDSRLDPELTRMALDWAEERASAGRPFHLGLWLCLGPHHLDRVEALIAAHWPTAEFRERRAMALALGRAGRTETLAQRLQGEQDPKLREQLQAACDGRCDQLQFAPLFAQG